MKDEGFFDGPVVKNHLPMQETWVPPWSGKIPYAMGQLRPHSTTTEPLLQSPGDTTTEVCTPRTCAFQQDKPLQ